MKHPICILTIACLACLLLLTAGDVYQNRLKTEEYTFFEDGQKVWLYGEITDKEPKSNGLAVTLKNAYTDQSRDKQFRILVYLSNENSCQIGDKVKIQGKMKQLQDKRNKGMFHQILYYKAKKIQYLCNGSEILLLEKGKQNLREVIYQLRMKCYHRLFEIFPKDTAAVAGGILLGIKTDMEEEVKEIYQQAGIYHLISISGLHISCIGLALYHLLRKLWGSYGVSGIVTSMFLLFYLILCGNSVSARRSVLMAMIMMGGWYLGRTYDMLSALSLAALILLVDSPYQLYQSGFQLSFGAVLGICLVSSELTKAFGGEEKWKQAVFANLGIQLTTMPIILYYYYELPVYSLLLNLILVPGMSLLLTSCIMALGCSLVSLTLGEFFGGVAALGFGAYEKIADLSLKLPFARIRLGQPSILGILCYYLVLSLSVWVIHGMNQRKQEILETEQGAYETFGREDIWSKAAFFTVLASGLFLCVHKIPQLRITMLDVGQGESFVIQEKRHVYLVDGGSTDVSQVGKYRMIPYLKSEGIEKIDGIFISHMDSDHISGIQELLEYAQKGEFQIEQIFLPKIAEKEENYRNLEQQIQNQNIPIIYAARGMELVGETLKIQILQPKMGKSYQGANEYSMVFQLNYREFSILFTGDVEGQGEAELLEPHILQNVTVLKTAHHGSKYTTSEEMLKEVRPKISLISCGAANSYGHPHEELLGRLREAGSMIYVTADFGQVTVETNGEDMVICNQTTK